MPFTLSHPLAAVLLRRTQLPMAAMVAGTTAPDLPMFLPFGDYSLSHSLAGVVSVDLLWSLAMVGLWSWVVRDALVDTAPVFVRERLPATVRYSLRQRGLMPLAAVIGSLTHIGWDAFTHEGRWGVRHLVWLREEHLTWAGYHWAQAVSSIVGLAGVIAWSATEIARRPRTRCAPKVPNFTDRTPLVIALVAAFAGCIAAMSQLSSGFHAAAIAGAEVGTATLACAVLTMSVAWQLLARRARVDADRYGR